jgi:arabinofuranan 3-O-arabinosyltransferase
MTTSLIAAKPSPDGVDPDVPAAFGPRPAVVERLRLATIALALVLLTFAQSAGQTAADTKIDLVTDPIRFLGKALKLWDPTGNAGQLQNQAYGYLFPVGPFFAVCHWLGFEPWVSQRLWQSTLVVLAFLGMVRLARALGVAGFWAPVTSGLTYALAPQVLSELFTISANLTPTVALPWVLLPLVRASNGGSPRRAAAWSGVALLFAGGTNAAATLAILPVPALWLLTRQRGPIRAALMRYWLLAVALASAWWAIPLVLLGRYSPPFLDWIEAAQNTTAVTSQSAILRGVEHWESYLGPGVWPAGWILVKAPAAVIATTVVAAAGLAGLAYRRTPNRLFLLSCLGLGLAILSFGHPSAVSGPFASHLQSVLDGPLVAFRNIHKFDPMIRLPIAVGVGSLLSMTRAPWWGRLQLGSVTLNFPMRLLAAVVVSAVALVAITPALGNRLVPQPRTQTIPSWWAEAGSWLNGHTNGARTLVVPGAATPSYFWGETVDDALQPETDAPWLVRSSVPLAQAGTIRLLDTIEARLAAGTRDDGLAALLTRSGIGYLLVRNDLNSTASLATPYNIVRSTILASPGFGRVAGFGPSLGGSSNPSLLIDAGAGVLRPAIEIFRVGNTATPGNTASPSNTASPTSTATPISLVPEAGAVIANGSSDDLGQLVDRGLPADRPVLFGADAGGLDAQARSAALSVATDGIRRQQATFGNSATKSATMTADAPFQGSRAAYDYLPTPAPALSTMAYAGIRNVSASSAGSDVYAAFNRSAAYGPFAAVDGDPSTAWHSASFTGAVRQWLQVDFDSTVSADALTIRFLADHGDYPTQLSVQTQRGSRLDAVAPTSAYQRIALPAGSTTFVRITVRSMASKTFGLSVTIADLSIPGVAATRTLRVPDTGSADLVAFDAAKGYRNGCLDVDGQPACADELTDSGEEDSALSRQIVLPTARTYLPTAGFLVQSTTAVDTLLDSGQAVRATASSVASTDPRSRAGAAVDGNPATTWSAAPGDPHPTLKLTLASTREVSGLTIHTAASAPVAFPQRVTVQAGRFRWQGAVPDDGVITFNKPIRTRAFSITVDQASLRESESTLTGRTRLLPVGISSLEVIGAPASTVRPVAAVTLGCLDGLTLTVDDQVIPLQLRTSSADVLAGLPGLATPCTDTGTPLQLRAGTHTLRLTGPSGVLPRSLTLTGASAGASSGANVAVAAPDLARSTPASGPLAVTRWDPTQRRAAVTTTAASLLVVHENFNAGWSAQINGIQLKAIQVDGWQQGFVLPAGLHGTVALSYGPQRAFDYGLLIGLAAVLALLALALAPARRSATGVVAAGRLPWTLQVALLALLGLQTGGAAGVLTVAVIIGAVRGLWPDGRQLPVWIPAATFLGAGIGIASASSLNRFTEANSSLTQLLTISAVVLAAAAGLSRRRR